MQKTYLIAFMALQFLGIQAQEAGNICTAVPGPRKTVKANWYSSKFMGVGANGELYVRNCTARTSNGTDFKYEDYLDKYGSNMAFASTSPYKRGTGPDKMVSATYAQITVNGQTYSLDVSDAPDKLSVALVELQPGGWEAKRTVKTLAEIAKGKKKDVYPGNWSLVQSPDNSKFAAINGLYNYETKARQWKAIVFDASAKVIWEGELPFSLDKNVKLPGRYGNYNARDFTPGIFFPLLLDNEGAINAVTAVRRDGQKAVLDAEYDWGKVSWKLLRYNAGGAHVFDLNLDGNKSIYRPYIVCAKNRTVACGFYSNDGKSIEGVFSIAVNNTGTAAEHAKTKQFEGDFFPSKVKEKGSVWDQWDVNLHACAALDNGGVVFAANQDFYKVNSSAHMSVSFTHSMDEIFMQVGADNEIKSVKKIEGTTALNSFTYKDNVYFISLDEAKDSKAPSLVLTRLNADGTFKKETVLADNKDLKTFAFHSLRQLNDNSFYTYAPPDVSPQGRTTYQLLKLTLK